MTSVIDGLKDLTASSTSTGPAGMWCIDTYAGTHINNFVKKKIKFDIGEVCSPGMCEAPWV